MAAPRKPSQERTTGERAALHSRTSGTAGRSQDLVEEFVWNVISVNMHLEDLRRIWAELLGISGSQWLLLSVIKSNDRGGGVALKDLCAKLHVDPSLVTTQTKSLEKLGFVQRKTSAEDARLVLMSLTDKAHKKIASLSSRHELMNEFVYFELDDRALRDLNDKLAILRKRLEKAPLRLAAEI